MRYRLLTTVDNTVMGNVTDGVALSGAGTTYTTKFSGHWSDVFALMIQWTGTLAGTLTLWATDKEQPDETSDNDWVQDTTFSPTNPAGSAGKFRDNVANGVARWWRIKYVNTSGAGSLFCYATPPRYRG